MTKILPIAITILRCNNKYLFLKRKHAPYEGLWSLVGGKINPGEHILSAAIREILEETAASEVHNYQYRGMVSERLVESSGSLIKHFLIFVGYAEIDKFSSDHREGQLVQFTEDEVHAQKDAFLPSDWYMFQTFKSPYGSPSGCELYEAELVQNNGAYTLNYYRRASP